jgi:hypothetical protein
MPEDYGVCYTKSCRPLVRMKSKKNLKRGQYFFDDKTGKYTFNKRDKYITITYICKGVVSQPMEMLG